MRARFVRAVYADHNTRRVVRDAVARVLATLSPTGLALNVGAGESRLHSRMINLDLCASPQVDVRGLAEAMPFEDDRFEVVITQEVLEHVADPFGAISEIARVLKPGGLLYCQLPFVIGYHPGPTDFWRFTSEGIRELVRRTGLVIEEQAITVGGATGYYRVSVEFWSVLLTSATPRLYHAAKGALALGLYPLKWLDGVLARGPERDRIAGGYYIIARKSVDRDREPTDGPFSPGHV